MTRPTPALLDPANYPFHVEITTRFADLDVQRHVNNVAMAAMIEDGRARFHRHINLVVLRDGGIPVVVANEINYLSEAHYPDPVSAFVGVLAVGRTSWTLATLIVQNNKPCAYAKTVVANAGGGVAIEVSADMRKVAQANRIAGAQEEH
jgi:acyl-CoA thioester hydrolase